MEIKVKSLDSVPEKSTQEVEETLHGMPARIFQHENEHMNGYVFTDLVSKFKLERAEKEWLEWHNNIFISD